MVDGLQVAFIVSLLHGMRHATDADHVVAITAIVNGEQSLSRAARTGVVWGAGHALTLLAAGAAIILFKVVFTPRIGRSLEMGVAVMLMVLGTMNLMRQRPAQRAPVLRPFIVGSVHGMAGSAAATLLIIPLIDDPRMAVLYLAVFGLGTIAGMTIVTLLIVAPASFAASRFAGFDRSLRLACGSMSLAFGAYLGYRAGFGLG
jgi:high-affinity nickel-transport protein